MKKKTNTCEVRHAFLDFLYHECEHQRQNGHFGVANNYRSAGNSFARFLSARQAPDIAPENLSRQLMADYEAWMQASGLCKNTTSFYLRALQSVYRKAVCRGLCADAEPFADVYRGVARTIKRAVTPADVARLRRLDIAAELSAQGYGGRRLENIRRQLELARDVFIFCFCARGLTFVDLAYLRKSSIEGGALVYVRRKTKQRIEVRIEPMMQDILSRYPSSTDFLLPILTRTADEDTLYRQYRYALARYNGHLRALGEMLGGLKLTSYVSRHSWASAARQQNVPLAVISQSLGHDSEKTTEIYLKELACNVINRTNHELLARVFRNKMCYKR